MIDSASSLTSLDLLGGAQKGTNRMKGKDKPATQKPTTLSLDREVVREAQIQCLRLERTLSSVVQELLETWLKDQKKTTK